jgi:small subunit ribosomal protein S4
MARYRGSVCRQCRREGEKLFLKGDRCYGPKCSVAKRSYPPGMHGQGRKKISDYGLQLREKQKAKRYYGLLEKQFRNAFEKAAKQKGITGENFLISLEMRMDNIVCRLGFAGSRKEARQLVTHGHFLVNDKKLDIPSAKLKAGDIITVKKKSQDSPKFKIIKDMTLYTPVWLAMDSNNLTGEVKNIPTREEIEVPISEHLIVELYSR